MSDRAKYAVIAAIDWQGGFSRHREIPWHFKEDFQHFRDITMNNICVMGKATYDDINNRMGDKGINAVLPGRDNFVLTSQADEILNATKVAGISDVLAITQNESRTIFFIGGERIFQEGLELADEVYLTIVPNDYQCDTFFPISYMVENFIIETEHETESGLTFIKAIRKKQS